jgi:hypothetical protein
LWNTVGEPTREENVGHSTSCSAHTRYIGLEKTQFAGYLVATAYNLVRMVRLAASATPA